ncbi:hypothetical protein [Proteus sp. G2666]|uniref:Uncharacterized protein n=1 Tax=Proteus penneri TaxID=102862 RepID=A0A385JP05_9GAMM|nr:hypothetical protein [Proteus sp. G2666]AXZ00034.1 hypothetical protein [Proteus penneri]NBM48238.1 hypothetical protein [Proteus sp. G2666]
MNIKFKKFGLTFNDKWNHKDINFFDLFKFTSYKGHNNFSTSLPFLKKQKRSIVNYLSFDEDTLWSNVRKNTRNEINKIKKEDIKYSINNVSLHEFINLYNEFIDFKNLSLTQLSEKRLEKYNNNILLTSTEISGKWQSIHVYLIIDKYSELLYSITNHNADHKTTGMANRFHHWNDLIHFKNHDYEAYDWGGIAFGDMDGIAKFKLSFGGEEIISNIYFSPLYYLTLLIREKPWKK